MELTIAVITKNRPLNLEKCLSSIINQTVRNFTVLIVDNDLHQSAESVFNHFKSLNKIQIEYVCEGVPGYSNARNCALNNCKTQFLGFVDDDCVIDEKWVENGLAAIKKYGATYVVGFSNNLESNEIFLNIERFFTGSWWVNRYDQNTFELKPDNFDTKNVILDKSILNQHQIVFDTQFNLYGGEDTDLGFQIKHQNLKGYYVPEMKLAHEEISNYRRFKKKAFSYGYNCYNLYKKWYPGECTGWIEIDYSKYFFREYWWKLFNLNQRKIIKTVRFFFFVMLFNFFYLRGFFKCKNDIK